MQTRLLPALLLLLPVQVRPCPWPPSGAGGLPGSPHDLHLVSPQYGLYAGEFLRATPAREQAQNGPDACASQPCPSALGSEGALVPPASWAPHPLRNCCCGHTPPPVPLPQATDWAEFSQGRAPLPASGHGSHTCKGQDLQPGPCPLPGEPGQSSTLEILGHHLEPPAGGSPCRWGCPHGE